MKTIDISGQKFGRLVVLEKVDKPNQLRKRAYFRCRCDCGTEKVIETYALRSGKTKSCGCINKENPPRKVIDIIGNRFGRLIVISRVENYRATNGAQFLCKCDCGNEKTVQSAKLRNGHTKSCGCYRVDFSQKKAIIHGMSKSHIYGIWVKMIQRCENPNDPGYYKYGGRGIKVCERWHDFTAWHADMRDRPSPQHSIERINNNGNYEPGNCRWATNKDQANNRRNNIMINLNGVIKTIAQWSDVTKIPQYTIHNRIHVLHWPIERALTERPNSYRYAK